MPSAAPRPSSGQALPPGTRLEEFVIEKVLGSGGFGITYLARDSRLGRQVVIKENLPSMCAYRDSHDLTVRPRHSQGEDAENFAWSLENFEKEAAMLASLDHPGIVKVHRSFEAFGTAYFVMPFVEGTALDEQIRHRHGSGSPFAEEEIRGLLWWLLGALDYLHARGIYHRDIKPANILITGEGTPVLIDFGAARQRLSEKSLTVLESPGYTPFEQLQSRGKVGPWSDLYALGATLYKAITGETPAKATDRAFDDPIAPLAGRPELQGRYSPRLLESIDKGLATRSGDRYGDSRQWRDVCWPQAPATQGVPDLASGPDSEKSPSRRENAMGPISFDVWFLEKCSEDPAHKFRELSDLVLAYNDEIKPSSSRIPDRSSVERGLRERPEEGTTEPKRQLTFEKWWKEKIREDVAYRYLEKHELLSKYHEEQRS